MFPTAPAAAAAAASGCCPSRRTAAERTHRKNTQKNSERTQREQEENTHNTEHIQRTQRQHRENTQRKDKESTEREHTERTHREHKENTERTQRVLVCLSVNFHFLVRGNNAFEVTVDGIEFASKDRFVFVLVWLVQVLICKLGLRRPPPPPHPPISMLGNVVRHLRTRFHYTRPRLTSWTHLFSTLKLGVRGGGEGTSYILCKNEFEFTCELDSIYGLEHHTIVVKSIRAQQVQRQRHK